MLLLKSHHRVLLLNAWIAYHACFSFKVFDSFVPLDDLAAHLGKLLLLLRLSHDHSLHVLIPLSRKIILQRLDLLLVPGSIFGRHLATRQLKLAQFSSLSSKAGLKLSFLLPEGGELSFILFT